MNVDPKLSEIARHYLWQQAPIVVLCFDPEGIVREANAYAMALLGQAVVGKRLGEVALDFAGDIDLHALTERGTAPVMLSLGVAGGDPLTLYFSFFRQDGGVIALGSVDPAEQTRLQKHVLTLHADMTNLTRELHKRNAELYELSRLKDQFLGMAAHDLRKPLGLILSTSELLLSECATQFDAEQHALVQDMIRATQHMSALIGGFLNVAVIESGNLELTLADVAASDLLARAARMVAPYAKLQGIHIKLQDALGDAMVNIDGSKIEQVLINLLSNAVDHAPADSEVILAAGLIDDEAAFWVQDHGLGIAPEIRDRLFTPFVKGPTVRATRDRSVGLGLVISRKIVEAHRGRIYVESEPGCGATFYIVLPGRLMTEQTIVDQKDCR